MADKIRNVLSCNVLPVNKGLQGSVCKTNTNFLINPGCLIPFRDGAKAVQESL